jgi:hypothetical protein
LHRICVDESSAASRCKGRDVLDDPRFVVGGLNADQCRSGVDVLRPLRQCRSLDTPLVVDGKSSDGGRCGSCRLEHRHMLDRTDSDVLPRAMENPIVRLGCAARKNDIISAATHERRHIGACLIDRSARPAALGVNRRGIAVELERRKHGRARLGP